MFSPTRCLKIKEPFLAMSSCHTSLQTLTVHKAAAYEFSGIATIKVENINLKLKEGLVDHRPTEPDNSSLTKRKHKY